MNISVSIEKLVLWLLVKTIEKNPSSSLLKSLIGNHELLIIAEAQGIEVIGLCIKLIHDNIEQVKVIATII